jgi:hypothetical protein
MAITVISSPSALSLAYRPMVYKFSSNATNLRYCIVEVLNNGVRKAAKTVQLDLGSTTNFTVDISDVIKTIIGFELNLIGSTGVLIPDNNSGRAENITLKVYEVVLTAGLLVTGYDPDNDNNNAYTLWIGNPVSDSLNSFNGYNWTVNHFDYNTFNISDYQLTTSSGKFLNNAPLIKDIELDSSEYLGLLNGYNAPVTFDFKLEVLTYNSLGALLNTDYINVTQWNNNAAIGNLLKTYLTIGVGTKNLINEGISLTNVSYYTVQLKEASNQASELRRFNIIDSCETDTRVHWANNFGKQDSYTFKGNKIETLTHNSSIYQKALKTSYNSSNRGFDVIENVGTRKFTVYTDSIGKNDYEFLSTMLVNKNAWVEINNSYFPIIIEDESLLIRDEKNVPIQFILVYSFANKEKGLRG